MFRGADFYRWASTLGDQAQQNGLRGYLAVRLRACRQYIERCPNPTELVDNFKRTPSQYRRRIIRQRGPDMRQEQQYQESEIDDAEKHRRELFMAGLMGASPQPAGAGAAYIPASATAQLARQNGQDPVPGVDPDEQKRRQLAMASLFGTPGAASATLAASHAPNASAASGPMAPPAKPVVPFDLHPPVVLMKGTHNPAFLISWHSQRDLLSELAWKSTLYIWGGPILTLVSVGFVLSRLGLLN